MGAVRVCTATVWFSKGRLEGRLWRCGGFQWCREGRGGSGGAVGEKGYQRGL